MNSTEAHFIGGPRDGQKIRLNSDIDYHEVRIYPEASAVQFDPNAPVSQCSTIENFTYRRYRLEYEVWAYIPASWFDRFSTTLHEFVIARLLRGYIGNPE